MEFNLELPINSTSLGQMSFGILFELFNRRTHVSPNIFPIGEGVDFSSFDIPENEEFSNWFRERAASAIRSIGKKLPLLRYWHIHGSERLLPNSKSVLWTVHELDSITDAERDICNFYDTVCLTSEYSQDVFERGGVKSSVVPNFFDSLHFFPKETRKQEGIINFAIIGKVEKRKNTHQTIGVWASKYASNPKFRLNSLVYNKFLSPEINKVSIDNIFRGNRPWNYNEIPFQPKNSSVNDLLNFCDILIDGSGGEGFGLPAFNAIALGKQVICMNAHGTKMYANSDNAILIEPSGKTDSVDGIFFTKGSPFNQGQIYTFDPADMSAAMDEAVSRVEAGIENTDGLKLKDEFSVKKTVDLLLSHL